MVSPSDGLDRERLGALFERAIELPPTARAAFAAHECRGEPELHSELVSLLDAWARAPGRLERMAVDILPDAIQDVAKATGPVGRTVSRYRIEAVIGGGGMGVVYRARDLALGRTVALKFLRPHLTGDREARARLESEARAASALDHPNIGVVHEIGAAAWGPGDPRGDRLYIAMAYYAGETIRQMIARGPLPIDQAVRIATQVAAGLARAHEAGIIHRDIKPANVIVTERGEAKILDFGVARSEGSELTRQGSTPGTVAYMSPEQTRGEAVDHRTDLWSLGALLYEMLTGQRAFPGADEVVQIHAIRHDAPVPLQEVRPEVPARLARIVATCLARDPAARYRQASDVAAALGALELDGAAEADPARPLVRGSATPAAREPAASLPVRTFFRRRPVVTVLVAAAAVSAVALLGRDGIGGLLGGNGSATTAARDGSQIMVLPFVGAAADSAVERLGRDLALMLAASLDGMGELRTIEPLGTLTQVPAQGPGGLVEARRLARRLGADRFVHGTLTRVGSRLRLDALLYDVGGNVPIARATVDADDLDALTDAAAIALLDQLWRREPPAVPSVAALTTSRVPAARRAYIEGERALSGAETSAAIAAFERAFAADTTFWWAYWRSLHPRFLENTAANATLVQKVIDHRWELPDAERRLVEAVHLSRSTAEQIARLQFITRDYPNHELAWWEYADLLVRRGGHLGYRTEDARSALERLLAINPRLPAAWNHLHTIAMVQADSAAAQRAAQEAARLAGTPAARTARQLRATLFESVPIGQERLHEYLQFMQSAPPAQAEDMASRVLADGFPASQIQLNRAARERDFGRRMAAALWRGEALAWAARGAWDSAFVATDRWVAAESRAAAQAELGSYRLAVAGVLLDAVPVTHAAARRTAAANAVRRVLDGSEGGCEEPDTTPSQQAAASLRCQAQVRQAVYQRSELIWLDGVLAYLSDDPASIVAARRALFDEPARPLAPASVFVSPWDSIIRPVLDRSLAALALDAAGDRERAARALDAIETEVVNRLSLSQVAEFHPLLATTHRLLAARWLLALGHPTDAARLLYWHEAAHRRALNSAWNRAIGGVAVLERAGIMEASGDAEGALLDYTRFLRWYDVPDPALQPLRDRANAGVQRLTAEGRR